MSTLEIEAPARRRMKVSDIKVPEGHVIVERSGWRGLAALMEEDEWATDIILGPERFRVVPVEMVAEYAALRQRHDNEHRDFLARLDAAPRVYIEVSVRPD